MSDEHPPSQLSSGWPSDTDLFNSVVTLRLLSNSNTDAGTDTARANPNHQSEYVPEVPKSNSGMFVPTECVDNNDDAAWDHTSWVPAGLVPPGLAFDDDLSVVSGQKGVDSSFPVHGQKVFPNDTILSNSDAFNQEDACTMSAGAVPRYLNIVSPVAQPNFVNFHELPLGHVLPMGRLISDMTMEAGESSVRQPHLSTCRLQSSKETLWMKNYRDLQEFKAEHGHTNVPQEYCKNPSLGNWVKYNRHKMREWGRSSSDEEKEKMKLLVEIGMMTYIGKGNAPKVNGIHLTPRQVQAWEMQFVNLCKYKEEYGDCDVPTNEAGEWKSLGEWVKRQRKVYRKFHSSREVKSNQYLVERFDRLKKIGFRFRIGSGRARNN